MSADPVTRRTEAAEKFEALTRRVPPGYPDWPANRSHDFKETVQKAKRALSARATNVVVIEEAIRNVERFYGDEARA